MKCYDCKQEMLTHVGCTLTHFEGGVRPRVSNQGEDPCHDCGAPPGTIHHFGCGMERCPVCEGQVIACGCFEEAVSKPRPLPAAIEALLDDTGIFTREEWCHVLNIEPEELDFLEGMPPETLNSLEGAVRSSATANKAPLEAWDALKTQALSDLTGFTLNTSMLPFRTLEEYLLLPHVRAFATLLLAVPSERRYEAICTATETLRQFRS